MKSNYYYSKISVFSCCFDYLLQKNININQTDLKGNNAILLCSKNWITLSMTTLSHSGADINLMNNKGENALIFYIRKKNKANVEHLLTNFNVNVNEVNKMRRTALHYLSNDEDTSADIDISIKEMILQRNADVNAQDALGRTPLHYLFIKMNKEFDNSPIDPIVSLDSFLTVDEVKVDMTDIYGNSPLHYCSQRGASICAMSLIKRGADLKLKNKEGNSPLAYSLIFKQVNSSIILMQQKALIYDYAHAISPRENLIKKNSFAGNRTNTHQNQSSSLVSGEENEEDEEEDTHQNQLSSIVSDEENEEDQDNSHNDQHLPNKKKGEQERINKEIFMTEEEETVGISLFRICVKFGYQGLTYLFINNGYDLMNAIQDSFFEKKFNLALLLLNKDTKKDTYRALNERQQNLFHILAVNGMSHNTIDLKLFYDKLYGKGISLISQDKFGYTPFHYACENHFISLCEYILKLCVPQAILSLKCNSGFTPFICAIRGERLKSCNDNIDLLLKYNNQVSEIYLEELYGKTYYCTPLIHATRFFLDHGVDHNNCSLDILSSEQGKIIIKLLSNGASIKEKDSLGLDCIMHCVRVNNFELVEILIQNYKNDIKYNAVDNEGFSVIHHAVCPMNEGSYENKKLLTFLINSGFSVNIIDKNGKTPVDYAIYQKTGMNLSILQKAHAEYANISIADTNDGIINADWASLGTKFESDADEFYKLKLIEHGKQIEIEVTPDPTANFPKDTHKLVKDANGEPYDLTMTKVSKFT